MSDTHFTAEQFEAGEMAMEDDLARREYVARVLAPLEWVCKADREDYKEWNAGEWFTISFEPCGWSWDSHEEEDYEFADSFDECVKACWQRWIDLHIDRIKWPPANGAG